MGVGLGEGGGGGRGGGRGGGVGGPNTDTPPPPLTPSAVLLLRTWCLFWAAVAAVSGGQAVAFPGAGPSVSGCQFMTDQRLAYRFWFHCRVRPVTWVLELGAATNAVAQQMRSNPKRYAT